MFRVGSIFIPVTNLDKSIDWYETHLGVKMIDRWDGGAGFYLPTGTTQVALVKVENKQPSEFQTSPNQRNGYFNFLVKDIDAAYRHFSNAHIKTSAIQDFGGMKFFDFYDLDGNSFCIVNEIEGSPYHSDTISHLQNKE